MKNKMPVSISKITIIALTTLGQMIKSARIERGISQLDLASRLNVSRYTVMSIEKGDPKVSVGVSFEAAYIVGIPLLGDDLNQLNNLSLKWSNLASILPKRVGHPRQELDNDF